MKVFLNPGHDLVHDSGAVSPITGLREYDVAAAVSNPAPCPGWPACSPPFIFLWSPRSSGR